MSQLYVDNIKGRTGGAIGAPSGVVVTGVMTATTGSFSGNVSVGGTLTYEDVTNIDSVGIITARSGIEFGASGVGGTISAAGNATIAGIITARGLEATGIVTATSFSGALTGNVTGDLTGEVNAAAFDTNAEGVVVSGIVTATTVKVGTAVSITGGAVSATTYHGDGGNLTNVGGVWVEIDKQTVTGSVGNVTVSLGANLGVTTSYSQFKVYYDVWLNGDGYMSMRTGYGFSGNHPTDNIKSSAYYYYSGFYNRAGDAALQTFRGEAVTATAVAGNTNKRHHWGEIIFFNTAGRIPTNGTAGWPSMSYRADGYSGGDTDSQMWSVAGHFDDGAQNPLSCFQIYADQNLVAGEVRTYGLSV